jgi:hypothetical protein
VRGATRGRERTGPGAQGYDRDVPESRDPEAYVVIRYEADSFEGALDTYEADLPSYVARGYQPATQVWGWDTKSTADWLVGGSSWKPGRGTLAVTYQRTEARP